MADRPETSSRDFPRPGYFLDGFCRRPLAFAHLKRLKRWLWGLAVVAAALVILFVRWAVPLRPAPRGAELVDGDALLFVHTPDFAAAREHFATSSVVALWNEPTTQALFLLPLTELRREIGTENLQRLSESLADILRAPQGETFLAVTRVGFPTGLPGIVVGADVKGNLFKAKLALFRLEYNLRRYNPGQTLVESRRYQGIRYKLWHFNPQITLCYTFFRSLAVVTVGEEPMQAAIARFAGDLAPGALARAPHYQQFHAALPATNDVVGYLNPGPVIRSLQPVVRIYRPLTTLVEPLAVRESAGIGVAFTPTLVRETEITQFRPGHHRALAAPGRTSLRFTTPATAAYLTRGLDCEIAYERLVQSIAALGRPRWNLRVALFEHTLSRHGIDLAADVLQRLGPELAVIVNWRPSAELPDVAVALQAADSPQLRAAIDLALNGLKEATLGTEDQAPWEELTHHGQTLRVARLGAGKIAPAYFLADGFLVLASDPDFARELIDHSRRAGDTLAAADRYRSAFAQLPATTGALTYCDTATLYERSQPLVRSLARQVEAGLGNPNARRSLPPAIQVLCLRPWGDWFRQLRRLPPPELLVPHLSPLAAVSDDQPTHRITHRVSPVGTPAAWVALTVSGLATPEALAVLQQTVSPPAAPRRSSGTGAPRPPPGNRKATSQTPPPPPP